MNEKDRIARDRRIEDLFLAGEPPSNMAERFHIQVARVIEILEERGFTVEAAVHRGVDAMWGKEGDSLRRAIWERAKKGAAKTLKDAPPVGRKTQGVIPDSPTINNSNDKDELLQA